MTAKNKINLVPLMAISSKVWKSKVLQTNMKTWAEFAIKRNARAPPTGRQTNLRGYLLHFGVVGVLEN